jgi:hypothetical protein
LFPVIVAFRQWGGGYLFSRGEKRLQVLDKRTGKPFRVEVQNAKGEILTPNDLELVNVGNSTCRTPAFSGLRESIIATTSWQRVALEVVDSVWWKQQVRVKSAGSGTTAFSLNEGASRRPLFAFA